MALPVQICFKDQLWRLTKCSPNARYRSKVPVSGSYEILIVCHKLLKQCRLSHACMGAPLEVHRLMRKKNKETISNSRRRIRFLLCFVSSCMLKNGWPVYIYQVSNWRECVRLQDGLQSIIDICRLTASACVHLSLSESGNGPEHFFRGLTLWALLTTKGLFFFNVDRTMTRVQTPPPIWKFFHLSATCDILRWPLIGFLLGGGGEHIVPPLVFGAPKPSCWFRVKQYAKL